MTTMLYLLTVPPSAPLPAWLMLLMGAVLFVGGVVVYAGGRKRGD